MNIHPREVQADRCTFEPNIICDMNKKCTKCLGYEKIWTKKWLEYNKKITISARNK